MSTILLTGVIRSGTTLICLLLNKLPNTVALDEPLKLGKVSRLKGHDFLKHIHQEFNHYRHTALLNRKATSVQLNHHVHQHYSNDKNRYGLREKIVQDGLLTIDKPLDNDFTLVVKHFVPFLLNLDILIKIYPVYGVVRNPLAILASMNTLATLQEGYYKNYTNIIPDVIHSIQQTESRIKRLVKLLAWFFEQCIPLLHSNHILYYEDLIASQGKALTVMLAQGKQLNEPLVNHNNNSLYSSDDLERMAQQLLMSDAAFWEFYSKAQVEQLLQEFLYKKS